MYRALTWLALERGVDLDDEAALASLAQREPRDRFERRLGSAIDGRDVTEVIRTAEIDRVVSSVARHPAVRAVLRERQRVLAEEGNAVMEGRDIGSVVVPRRRREGLPHRRRGRARTAPRRTSGPGSARTRSPPTCVSATSATPQQMRPAPDAQHDRHDRALDRRGRRHDRGAGRRAGARVMNRHDVIYWGVGQDVLPALTAPSPPSRRTAPSASRARAGRCSP